MNVVSTLVDGRIESTNFLVEMPISEYLALAAPILNRNEFQRRRVTSSKTVYTLLKQDILRGCVIPPIVLALTDWGLGAQPTKETLPAVVFEHLDKVIILDGLQRSHSLVDLHAELEAKGDEAGLARLSTLLVRCEFYVGINRLGILYRMLTLNTGQTPMSLRQQIEMLYLDYARHPPAGIRLVREVNDQAATGLDDYNFKDVIEGFNSYLERNELPLERADLLENIKSLEKLSQENADRDIFNDFLNTWATFNKALNDITNGFELSEESIAESGRPWGKNALQVFKKPQAISGFGAAIGRLKDYGLIASFQEVQVALGNLTAPEDVQLFLMEINKRMSWISSNAKKIGNEQRMYFQYYFRELLNRDGDAYLNLDRAVESAFQKYKSQTV